MVMAAWREAGSYFARGAASSTSARSGPGAAGSGTRGRSAGSSTGRTRRPSGAARQGYPVDLPEAPSGGAPPMPLRHDPRPDRQRRGHPALPLLDGRCGPGRIPARTSSPSALMASSERGSGWHRLTSAVRAGAADADGADGRAPDQDRRPLDRAARTRGTSTRPERDERLAAIDEEPTRQWPPGSTTIEVTAEVQISGPIPTTCGPTRSTTRTRSSGTFSLRSAGRRTSGRSAPSGWPPATPEIASRPPEPATSSRAQPAEATGAMRPRHRRQPRDDAGPTRGPITNEAPPRMTGPRQGIRPADGQRSANRAEQDLGP